MLRNFIFAFIILTFADDIVAQTNNFKFILNGTFNTDTGLALLMPVSKESYYPHNHATYNSQIVNGKFRFTDSIAYPYEFRLVVKIKDTLRYISDFFIVDTGIQNIVCNIDSQREVPSIINRGMIELKTDFADVFKPVELEFDKDYKSYDSLLNIYDNKIPDSLQLLLSNEKSKLHDERNSILLHYVQQHPDSYVALWNLIKQFNNNGYERVFDSIYNQFSDSIKATFTGQALLKELSQSGVVAVGKQFPKLMLLDQQNQAISIPSFKSNSKYIFIDFWFSSCEPCISQFEQLKNIVDTYNVRGFEIIGISTDNKSDINNWKSVITKYKLSWKQYLDANGKEAKKLSILLFPSNFLLDSNGKIIMKNIEPTQLSSFLQKNL